MIQEIKKRLSCPEYLARRGIHVKNHGRCVSPLREGAKNPTSFLVDDDYWHDFGSGDGGDVIDLAAALEHGGDVGKAVRALSRELGIRQVYDLYNNNIRLAVLNYCLDDKWRTSFCSIQ